MTRIYTSLFAVLAGFIVSTCACDSNTPPTLTTEGIDSVLPHAPAVSATTSSTLSESAMLSSPNVKTGVGLEGSTVVCKSCSPELLAAKERGIRRAMKMLVGYAGVDALPQNAPIIFHLEGDEICGRYVEGMTGYTGKPGIDGKLHACLFEVEKKRRYLPFTTENAEKLIDQQLATHEAGHAWFFDRVDHEYQELFVQLVTSELVLLDSRRSFCEWLGHPEHGKKLAIELCLLGFSPINLPEILLETASAVKKKGASLTTEEFAAVIGSVLGKDARPAFRKAGFLPPAR